jgi:hypothetical protein
VKLFLLYIRHRTKFDKHLVGFVCWIKELTFEVMPALNNFQLWQASHGVLKDLFKSNLCELILSEKHQEIGQI